MREGGWANHFRQVVERQATGHGVDAHGLLFDAGGARLGEQPPDVRAGGRFLARRDRVFEVVGDAVDSQGAGFVEHFGRGARD